jgi:hypothetical protein
MNLQVKNSRGALEILHKIAFKACGYSTYETQMISCLVVGPILKTLHLVYANIPKFKTSGPKSFWIRNSQPVLPFPLTRHFSYSCLHFTCTYVKTPHYLAILFLNSQLFFEIVKNSFFCVYLQNSFFGFLLSFILIFILI